MPCASRVGRARRDGAREGRRGCSGRRRPYRPPAGAAAASAAAAGAAARAAGARLARRVLPPGSLEAAGRQYSFELCEPCARRAPAARARPAASRRRRNMAYSTALRRRKRLAGSAVCRRGGSFGVLSPSQGAAEGVRNRDNPPPQPRPVEAHLSTAMRSPLGAPGGRSAFKPRARREKKNFGGAFLFQCAGVKRDEIPTAEGLPPSSF